MDILVKEKDGWIAYEVKSTTSVKPVFLPDATLQYYVISNSGNTLTDIFIIHLNNTYIRKGKLEIEKLFHEESVLERITHLQSGIIAKAAELKALLLTKIMPIMAIGKHCNQPYTCDFYGYCSRDVTIEAEKYQKHIDHNCIADFISQFNGMDASTAFYNRVNEPDAEKALATRQALLKYYELDTFAMVKLLDNTKYKPTYSSKYFIFIK